MRSGRGRVVGAAVLLLGFGTVVLAEGEDQETEVVGGMGRVVASQLATGGALYLQSSQSSQSSQSPTGRGRETAPVLDTTLQVVVTGTVGRVRVAQRFANPGDDWLHGVYVFPLPPLAAVDTLRMTVGTRVFEGRIEERAEAKRIFAKAKREGRKASLVEQERPNVFTTSVANIGPREEVRIEIEFQQTLAFSDGRLELRVPLVVAPRFIPGENPEGAAGLRGTDLGSPPTAEDSDASRITPPLLASDDPSGPLADVTLDIAAGFPLAGIECPSHPDDLTMLASGAPGVQRFALRGVPADRDFVLRWWPQPGREPHVSLLSERDGGEAYALLMLVPPEDASLRSMTREVVFVIDTSGSMAGLSIRAARAALHLALDRLASRDAFNIVKFSGVHSALFPKSRGASPANLSAAHAFVDQLHPSGGTLMLPALERALRDPGLAVDVRQVVFVTDGAIGNEDQLFAAIARDLGRSRLFLVGLGSAPNAHFLQRAAAFGRGSTVTISRLTEVRVRMDELFEKLERPVLTDIEVHWNDVVEVWPERIPDLYSGEPLVVAARIPRFAGDIVVTGRRAGAPFEVRLPLVPGESRRGIAKLWARRKIASLMDRRANGADAKAIRAQVLEVALRYGLVSKYTSLVAIDVTPTRPQSANGVTRTTPLRTPAGWIAPSQPGGLPAGGTSKQLLFALAAMGVGSASMLWLCARHRAAVGR